MSFRILGTGSGLPSLCITNDDLSKVMDTSDEWIRTRTGIEKRRICGEETITDLAETAAKRALEDSGVSAEELDLIICATLSADYITPSMACVLQERLGAKCPAFDLNAACTGFLYAMDVAAGYFARNDKMKILIVAAEAISKLVDWRERNTSVIFADGAGAVVLGEGNDLLAIRLTAKGNTHALAAPNISGNCPFRQGEVKETFLEMDGKEVFRFAVSSMCRDIKAVMKLAGVTGEEIDYVLPHQANMRILDSAINRLDIDGEKFLTNINCRGNTSAAAIPLLLDEANKAGTLKKGNLLAMSSFGGGLTTGACILRWSK